MNSWVELDERSLAGNYHALRRAAGRQIPVLAVIKANAYGHGAALCAPVLARAGAPWLGVTDAAEGARVRAALGDAGLALAQQPEILVMCGGAPEDAELVIDQRLTATIWEVEQLDWLARAARHAPEGSRPVPFPVHLELDTGMSRQGAAPGAALDRVLDHLERTPALRLDGVFTHLASAEVAQAPETRDQLAQFGAALSCLSRRGLRPRWLHAGNTSAVDNGELVGGATPPLGWLTEAAGRLGAHPMVRSGLALYGYALPIDGDPGAARLAPQLSPVALWKTRIRSVREISAGAGVGYNLTAHAERPMRLALLPVGYADGLRRELSSSDERPGGWTIVHGRRAPIVGRVSMNLTTIDVTEIAEAAVGDEVTVLGTGISAKDHARLADTIAYEILCGVRPDDRRLVSVSASASLAGESAFAHAASAPVAST